MYFHKELYKFTLNIETKFFSLLTHFYKLFRREKAGKGWTFLVEFGKVQTQKAGKGRTFLFEFGKGSDGKKLEKDRRF
jgi:hypothetical protein